MRAMLSECTSAARLIKIITTSQAETHYAIVSTAMPKRYLPSWLDSTTDEQEQDNPCQQ